MTLDRTTRDALRHMLETAAPFSSGTRVAALAAPVRRIFLVRSGSAAMLREALASLRRITPLPELCVLGRDGDAAVLAQAWPGTFDLIVAPGDRDYAWRDLADCPGLGLAHAMRACTHHGFLALSASANGYDNLFEIFAACGVTACFAAITGGGLVQFDLDRDELRRASVVLCEAIVRWTDARVRSTAGAAMPVETR
jgi:hypothetical protein